MARELRTYRDQITFDPERLNQVEERLDALAKLKRKYGQGIPEILDYAAKLRKELDSLGDRTERQQELVQQLAAVEAELITAVQALSVLRREAADRLEAAVMEQLHEVNMGKTVFKVALNRIPDAQKDQTDGAEAAVGRRCRPGGFMVAPTPAKVYAVGEDRFLRRTFPFDAGVEGDSGRSRSDSGDGF